MKVSVLGTGAWGTTLAQVLVDAGHETIMWGRNSAVVDEISTGHTNEKFLPGIQLPNSSKATTSIADALTEADAAVIAVPAQALRENLRSWKAHLDPELPLISTLKGIEVGTDARMTQVMMDELGISTSTI